MLSKDEERHDRIETMLQDVDLRRQQQERERAERGLNTYAAFAQEETLPRGRYDQAINPPTVVGAKPDVASVYPAASSAHQTELPPELPTGHDINEMPPLEPSIVNRSVEATGGAEALSFSMDVERAAPPFSTVGDSAPASHLPARPARVTREAGSSSNKDEDNG